MTRTKFRDIWSQHQCEVKGCGKWLVCDGGMKPNRYSPLKTDSTSEWFPPGVVKDHTFTYFVSYTFL